MNDAVRQTLLARVYDVAVETPLHPAHKATVRSGNNIYLKREDLQPVHSFKIRGAYNKIVHLSDDERKQGIIAASAGNHAQGVALSAQKLGIRATIVMPRTTPAIKVEAVMGYGAEVLLEGDNYSEAYEASQKLVSGSGGVFIHPFNDPAVIAGQGTIGREILEQLPTVDVIFVPVGGGGLIAGIAQYVKQLKPDVTIIGVEPEDSNAMQASLEAGACVKLPHVGVFADGVAVKYVGDLTFSLCREFVDSIITVSNDQICAAIKSIFEETRSIVEPAGALSLAGAEQYAAEHRLRNKHLVTICSGANMPFEKLQFVAERTLLGSGGEALFEITLPERPGALAELCSRVVRTHNISEFCYRLSSRDTAHILVGINIRGAEDKHELVSSLGKHHYQFTDLSGDDTAKEHVRHMIGGPATMANNEAVYEINFPERPGALGDFLAAVGQQINISLFHYRGQGGDVGKVLIGFETEDRPALDKRLIDSGYDFRKTESPGVAIFLGAMQR